jgi:hypothetical protein
MAALMALAATSWRDYLAAGFTRLAAWRSHWSRCSDHFENDVRSIRVPQSGDFVM